MNKSKPFYSSVPDKEILILCSFNILANNLKPHGINNKIMSRNSNYRTWSEMNNEPDRKEGAAPGTKPRPKSTSTIELKDTNHLKFALKNSRVVIVKAEADWCEPCKVLTPKYEELATKCGVLKNHFAFFTDDIDSEKSHHVSKVTAVPSFFVYTDGDITPKKIFTGDFDQLSELVNRILFRMQQDAPQPPEGQAAGSTGAKTQ